MTMESEYIQFWISLSFAMMGGILCVAGLFIRTYQYFLNKDKATPLLCIGVMALVWHTFIYCMIYTKQIQYYPQIYNKGIPLYYLIAPCFYFYVKFRLKPNGPLTKYWPIHLIPFIFGLIDIIPYAMASLEEKKVLLQYLVNDISSGFKHSYGYVDQKLHYVVRFLLAAGYVIAQWQLLFITEDIDRKIKKDISRFTKVYTILLLLQCSMVVAVVFNNIQESYILKSLDKLVWVGFCFMLFSIWFFCDTVTRVRSKGKYTSLN